MVITKVWLDEKLVKLEAEIQTELSESKLAILLGKKEAYKDCYKKLTEPPLTKEQIKNQEQSKVFDKDKTYEEIVRFYIDKKGYTKEHANSIAQKIVAEQEQKRL